MLCAASREETLSIVSVVVLDGQQLNVQQDRPTNLTAASTTQQLRAATSSVHEDMMRCDTLWLLLRAL